MRYVKHSLGAANAVWPVRCIIDMKKSKVSLFHVYESLRAQRLTRGDPTELFSNRACPQM